MADLEAVAAKLMEAAYSYWEAAQKTGIDGAVIWLQDTSGKMVIFTRGEYRHILMRNIEEIGDVRSFGCVVADEAVRP